MLFRSDEFLDDSIVLPPGDWDENLLLPVMHQRNEKRKRKREGGQEGRKEGEREGERAGGREGGWEGVRGASLTPLSSVLQRAR